MIQLRSTFNLTGTESMHVSIWAKHLNYRRTQAFCLDRCTVVLLLLIIEKASLLVERGN